MPQRGCGILVPRRMSRQVIRGLNVRHHVPIGTDGGACTLGMMNGGNSVLFYSDSTRISRTNQCLTLCHGMADRYVRPFSEASR
jgi:hypothetical protein